MASVRASNEPPPRSAGRRADATTPSIGAAAALDRPVATSRARASAYRAHSPPIVPRVASAPIPHLAAQRAHAALRGRAQLASPVARSPRAARRSRSPDRARRDAAAGPKRPEAPWRVRNHRTAAAIARRASGSFGTPRPSPIKARQRARSSASSWREPPTIGAAETAVRGLRRRAAARARRGGRRPRVRRPAAARMPSRPNSRRGRRPTPVVGVAPTPTERATTTLAAAAKPANAARRRTPRRPRSAASAAPTSASQSPPAPNDESRVPSIAIESTSARHVGQRRRWRESGPHAARIGASPSSWPRTNAVDRRERSSARRPRSGSEGRRHRLGRLAGAARRSACAT